MAFDPLSAALDVGKTLIEKMWPDPVKQAEEMRKLEALHQAGDLAELNAHVQLLTGQMAINKIEAAHPSIFVAGWRPFIGWVGGFSLAYAGIVHPLLVWLWTVLQAVDVIPADADPPPFLESATLTAIVTGMLGIGTMRSIDKSKGVDSKGVGKGA